MSLPPSIYKRMPKRLPLSMGFKRYSMYFDGTYYYPATEILTLGYDKKTIYLISDQNGTLDIEVDPDLRGNWQTYDSISVTANTLATYIATGNFARMRFKFTPSATATVSAWVDLE